MKSKLHKAAKNRIAESISAKPLKQDFIERRPEIIGYARVSTQDQSLDMQITALKKAGCTRIFHEKESAKDFRRPELHNLRKHIEPGDVVIVYSISRLSRDTLALLGLFKEFKAEGVELRSLTEPLDLATPQGRMVATIQAAVDQNEREQIAVRTKHGMAERMRQGQQMGRPEVLTAAQKREVAKLRKTVRATVLASRFKVSVASIYKCQ